MKNTEITKELQALNDRLTSIEAAQKQISDKLTRVEMEQISQRESQYRLERRVINHVNATEEGVSTKEH